MRALPKAIPKDKRGLTSGAELRRQKAVENLISNGFNQSKALQDAGYSQATAENDGKRTMTRAIKTALQDTKDIDTLGISKEEFIKEYGYVVKQTKDISSKLKSLQSISHLFGYSLKEDKDNQAPVFNIAIRELKAPVESKKVESRTEPQLTEQKPPTESL